VSPPAYSILVVLTSLSCSQHPEPLLLLKHLSPLLLKMVSKRSGFRLTPHGTRVGFLFSNNSPPNLRQKLKSSSHSWSNSSVVRRRLVRLDEGSRDKDHARVCLPLLIIIVDCTTLIDTCHACRLCGDAEYMHSIWQRYDALATDGDSGSPSGARVFTVLKKCEDMRARGTLLLPSCALSPHVHHYSMSLCKCWAGCARERLDVIFTWSQFRQHRGDGGDGSKCDCLERCRNGRY